MSAVLTALFIMLPVLLKGQILPQQHTLAEDFSKNIELSYLLYKPANYRPSDARGLVLYLTGEDCIDDISRIRRSGPPMALDSGLVYDYFLVAPQLPGDEHWDPDALKELVEDLGKSYNLDDTKFTIIGIGDRGGFGAYEFCVSYPGIFDKICVMGATACTEICRMGTMDISIYHGALDSLVDISDAANMAYEMETYCGLTPTVTYYEDLGNNVWDRAFSEPEFWRWLTGSNPVYSSGRPVPTVNTLSLIRQESMEDDYLIYLPRDYSETVRDWPLLVFLHGSGSPVSDINAIRTAGPPMNFEQGMDNSFILLCPHLSEDVHWDVDKLNVLLDKILDSYRVDRTRVYLTGLSRGGFGAWEFAVSHPDLFAAVIPISARDVPGVERLKDTPVWIFHGALDDGVPWQGAETMYNRLRNAGSPVHLTMYPGVGHWAWIPAYEDDDLWTWMLSQMNLNPTGLSSPIAEPAYFHLSTVYPNPFNNMARVTVELPFSGSVDLSIFDSRGRLISNNRSGFLPAGTHTLAIQSEKLPSGIYFLQADFNGRTSTRKFACLR